MGHHYVFIKNKCTDWFIFNDKIVDRCTSVHATLNQRSNVCALIYIKNKSIRDIFTDIAVADYQKYSNYLDAVTLIIQKMRETPDFQC